MNSTAISQLSGFALQPFIAIKNKNAKRFVEGTHRQTVPFAMYYPWQARVAVSVLKNNFAFGVDHYSSSFTNSWPPMEENLPEGPTLKIMTKYKQVYYEQMIYFIAWNYVQRQLKVSLDNAWHPLIKVFIYSWALGLVDIIEYPLHGKLYAFLDITDENYSQVAWLHNAMPILFAKTR